MRLPHGTPCNMHDQADALAVRKTCFVSCKHAAPPTPQHVDTFALVTSHAPHGRARPNKGGKDRSLTKVLQL